MQVNDRVVEYMVRGAAERFRQRGDFVVMDIATAQRDLARPGRVDRVSSSCPVPARWNSGKRGFAVASRAASNSPRRRQTDENRRMLAAFRWNLRILSYVALVVGVVPHLQHHFRFGRPPPRRNRHRARPGCDSRRRDGCVPGRGSCFGVAGGVLGMFLGRCMATARLSCSARRSMRSTSAAGLAPIELTSSMVALDSSSGSAVVARLQLRLPRARRRWSPG